MPDPLLSLLVAAAIAVGCIYVLSQYPRWQRWRETTDRVLSEDALKHIHKFEMKNRQPTVESIAGMVHLSLDETAELLATMEHDQLLQIREGTIHLSAKGRMTALHIIRAHRLWERYLAEETGYDEAEWHGRAERLEHRISREEIDSLAARLGNPTHDPHGDPIPTAAGTVIEHRGQVLCSIPENTTARIERLEDEPAVVYAQLVAEGLYPGMLVRIIESTADRVRFWADGNEHLLAPIVAMHIYARELPADGEEPIQDHAALSSLPPGKAAEVIGIARSCRRAERRRFLDLGFVPGTRVVAEMRSPVNDPTAYRVRGALIALRRDQAAMIHIKEIAS